MLGRDSNGSVSSMTMKHDSPWWNNHARSAAAALRSRGALAAYAFLVVWTCAAHGHAFSSLFEHVHQDATLAALLPESAARASMQDGVLFGTGSERLQRLPDGALRVDRTRRYTHVRHPKTGKFVKLPEVWEVTAALRLTPQLRLVSCDTRFNFKREADNILGDYRLSEHQAWMFEKDRSVLRANKDGTTLTRQDYLAGKPIKTERYDYPQGAMPVEILGLVMGIAVQRRIDQFDFELIVPDGDTHGVRAQVRRTRDLHRFAKGYRVPPSRLKAEETLAVVDIHLSSPIKSLFFPHHFYLAYADHEPWQLMMMWGGDPSETIQAFRIE
jgi:hypothetical protein